MTYTKQQWVDGQTRVDAQHLNHIEQGIANVESSIPDVSGFATKEDTYTKEQIDAKISSVMSYKGTVATVEDLPSSATIGDVYNVTSTGMNYAWNGNQWDALGSDIDLSNYVTNEQLQSGLETKQNVGDYATNQQLTEGLATKQAVGDYPIYQKFSAGADPTQRKTIQLANADSISGISTNGDGANLIMLSKWDKVDIGSTKYQMNLNSPDGVVQINDEKVIATTDQIPDVSEFISQSTLDSALANKQNVGDYALKSEIPDISGLATKQELTEGLDGKQDVGNYALKSEIPDTSNFATHTEVTDGLATKQDKGDYATNEVVQAEFESYDKTIKSYVDSKLTAVYTYKGSVANEQALPTENQTIGDVYNVEDTGKNVAWDGEKWDSLSGNVDLSAYAQTEYVNTELAKKANQTQVDTIASDVNNIGNVIIPEMNTNTAKALATKVDWDSEKKVISLPMDGSISALRNAETLEGGVLIAQRSYDENVIFVTEVGTTKNKLTLNASERPQIDIAGGSSEKVAFVSDIPSIEGLATQTALTEGLASKADAVHTHAIADVNGLQAILDLMPVEIKLPIRTGIGGFQDKLYTQEEIFAWFGVTDLSGFLALAKSTRQVWISYVVGASFKTSAYRYLANYMEYVPASQSITVIWVGPDSANADVISKFVFKANLDQTVISGASNVQLTVTSIE